VRYRKPKITFSNTLLDIAVAGFTRGVNNISLTDVVVADDLSSAVVTFDFLDFEDGGVIQVLTVGPKGDLKLSGDIIGMPEGIKTITEMRPSRKMLNRVGGWIAVLFELGALVLSVWSYRWITGSWAHVWLLALPFVALFAPAVIILVVAATLWPSDNVSLPESVCLPKWFGRLSVCFPNDVVSVSGGHRTLMTKQVNASKTASAER
jgi:hypothetical protein